MTSVEWQALDGSERRSPGYVAAIVRNGAVDAYVSAGTEVPGGELLSTSTPFYVASVAKQFTGAAIATLVRDGEVALDQPVTTWLAELDPSWSAVHVHHLVEHTAGLHDANMIDAAAEFNVSSTMTTRDRVAVITAQSIDGTPGRRHQYNNHGYVLLAEIVHRSTGQTLGEFCRTHFFEPLGMNHSRFLDTAGPAPVAGWKQGMEPVTVQFTCVGDGGLITTANDLALWDGWLPSSSIAELMLGQRPVMPTGLLAHDAWGISIRAHHGQRIESHGGAIDGYLASYVRFPRQDLSVIVLANTDEPGVDSLHRTTQQLVDDLTDVQFDHSQPPWTRTHGLPIP